MAPATASIWLRRYASPAPPRARLLCLPHAGGSATFFHSWGGALGDDVEVLTARYPGRQERIGETPMTSIEELADGLAAELPPYLDAPLALFGHSMGASVAYEIAHRLEAHHGTAAALLMVSCRKPPHLVAPRGRWLRAAADGRVPAGFRPGTDAELVDEVLRLGGTDAALLDDDGMRDLLLPQIRADFEAVDRYTSRPGAPLGCPVVGYLGVDDPGLTGEDVAEWSSVAPKGFDLKALPGGHFYLTDQRDALLEDIRTRLERVR
ncbi:alpha/beta fold hydrolase [Streptomyces sp. tea 10]|nr:alpha/beta fold hydrolase [Streptomyces sp. tea 10]